jgi:catechol 2,3-dioxygenase-like lactoylglutathione lyase family enzyme
LVRQYRAVIETEGLTHIHLVVRDLERSLAFYRDVFGMQELFWDGPHMVFVQTPGSRDLITLNADPAESERAGQPGGIGHFGFRLKNSSRLDDAITTVEHAGGRLITRGEHSPGVAFAYVADPDGYVIEL